MWTLFNDHLYDETYRIASGWKFFIECLIFRQCSYAHLDVIVARYDQTGISSVNQKLYEEEREQILHLLLPDRIYADYIYLGDADSPLLKLTPYFNRTRGFQQLIYGITYALIRFLLTFCQEVRTTTLKSQLNIVFCILYEYLQNNYHTIIIT